MVWGLFEISQTTHVESLFLGIIFHPTQPLPPLGIMNVTAVQPNKCRFFLKILGFTIFFSSDGFPFKLVGMRDANL